MGKANNLGDFMTDLADAIREKTKENMPINPQDFSQKIKDIQTGGGGSVPEDDVNFYDYDGTLLHSYSKDLFLSLTEMPELPKRKGLVCDGWNWDMEQAKDYVSKYGGIDVGATYITDDGKTRLYITIAAEGRMDVPLYFGQAQANSVVIDWGDGSPTETMAGTGKLTTSHQYAAIGDYCITLDVVDDTSMLSFGSGYSSGCILGNVNSNDRKYVNMLRKVELGRNVKFSLYEFYNCIGLEYITAHQGIENLIGSNSFTGCESLKCVVIPKGVNSMGTSPFKGCNSLSKAILPSTLKSFGSGSAFSGCVTLDKIFIPEGVTSIGYATFSGCKALKIVGMPQGITSLGDSVFSSCSRLTSISIPLINTLPSSGFSGCYSLVNVTFFESITSIGSNAFNTCTGVKFYDFSHNAAVPTLANTSAFKNIPSDCKIIVPDALYDEWIAATNWSTYASNIIKKTDWDASQA